MTVFFKVPALAPNEVTREAPIARPRAESRRPIPALTGLRFFAAFFILFAHGFDWIAQFVDANMNTYFSFVAMYGMPLFFVLSGFVIHYNYRDLFLQEGVGRAVCEFAAARFARLYPLYFVFLFIAIGADEFVVRLYHAPYLAVPILTYYGTLTQTWWYLIYEGQSIIYWLFSVSWSISTEMFFYATFAALIFLIVAVCRPRRTIFVAVAYAALVIGALGLACHELEPLLAFASRHVPEYIGLDNFEHSFYRWLFYFSPYMRVLEFILGCLAAQAFMEIDKLEASRREHRIATVALALALLSLPLFGVLYLGLIPAPQLNAYIQFYALNFLCAPSIAVILFCVARYDTPFARLMSAPLVVALGETSYSIYLVHSWTLRLFEQPAVGYSRVTAAYAVYRVICGIGLTLLVSYASYQLIELPGRVWVRGTLRRALAVAFRDRQRSAAPPIPQSGLPDFDRRAVFSLAALSGLVVFVLAASPESALRTRLHRLLIGNRPEIAVISASYGENCKDFPVPPPFRNSASPGNLTKVMKRACDGNTACDFLVSAERYGDPVNGCGKDFSVEYRCGGRPESLSIHIPGEADGKHALLSCRVLDTSGPTRSDDGQRLSDMSSLKDALNKYFNDKQSYPATPPADQCSGSYNNVVNLSSALVPKYISSIPHDPHPRACEYNYLYVASPDGKSYALLVDLQDIDPATYSDRWCIGASSGTVAAIARDGAGTLYLPCPP